jgi:hypothetical protein
MERRWSDEDMRVDQLATRASRSINKRLRRARLPPDRHQRAARIRHNYLCSHTTACISQRLVVIIIPCTVDLREYLALPVGGHENAASANSTLKRESRRLSSLWLISYHYRHPAYRLVCPQQQHLQFLLSCRRHTPVRCGAYLDHIWHRPEVRPHELVLILSVV